MNREDSAKVGGWLDHASKMARTVAEHNAEETIAALTAERDNALAALRRRSSQRDQLDARCEELFVQREELRAVISSVRALTDPSRYPAYVDRRLILAALDGSGTVEAAPRRRLEDLGNVPFRFWACPIQGHSEGDWRVGAPVVTVEWRGDVAYCMAPGCGRSSADLDGTHPDVPAPGRSGEEKRPCPHCGPDHEFGHGYSGLPVDGEEQK